MDEFRFKYGEYVQRLKGMPVQGTVVGFIKRLNGARQVVLQEGDLIWVVDESDACLTSQRERNCKHDRGFRLRVQPQGHNHYCCAMDCGYYINFNPDNPEDGLTFYEKQEETGDKKIKYVHGGP